MEMSPFLPLCDGLHIEGVTESANVLLVHVVSRSARVCCHCVGQRLNECLVATPSC
jgi:hypothetical protein